MKQPDLHLNNSELKIMDILWEENPLTAKEVTLRAAERYGWNKNTTYTILKGLVAKEYVSRADPNFICVPLIALDRVRRTEAKGLIDKLYKGSVSTFFSSFLEDGEIDRGELEELQKLIDSMK